MKKLINVIMVIIIVMFSLSGCADFMNEFLDDYIETKESSEQIAITQDLSSLNELLSEAKDKIDLMDEEAYLTNVELDCGSDTKIDKVYFELYRNLTPYTAVAIQAVCDCQKEAIISVTRTKGGNRAVPERAVLDCSKWNNILKTMEKVSQKIDKKTFGVGDCLRIVCFDNLWECYKNNLINEPIFIIDI